mgnify:CR=1 FL=1
MSGCAQFNLVTPRWQKTDGKYPDCSVCGGSCYWMWGYKHFAPDLAAQRIQGGLMDATDRYYHRIDGWGSDFD